MNKQLLSTLLLVSIVFLPIAVNAQSSGSLKLCTAIKSLGGYMVKLLAAVSTIMFAVAGYLYLTSQGDPGKMSNAKSAIIAGVIGVVIVLLASTITDTFKDIFGFGLNDC